ncbi:MAG: hypothetical protein AVDCRST_MAG64-3532 [uncultured Phycisphaerae bacterium]|uniref:Uncharacterized protein n=1 Tax=uncultured Phycisphaerae bacterium TaxID=904963 RepID=A0A6J4Q9M1_9BACT|nr:MAG: hypothetical protein AVDCRST_MAG64-3532 [uncultured Phycisphaerae bacterium]
MLRVGCVVILMLLIGIPAISARFMPWWGTVLVILGEAVLVAFVAPKLAGWAFKRVALGLFMTKSRVLRGATVQVHRVELTAAPQREPASAPAPVTGPEPTRDVPADDEDGAPAGIVEDGAAEDAAADDDESSGGVPRHHVLVDFTITPRLGASRMQFYDPSELLLVPFDAPIDMNEREDPTTSDRAAGVERVWLVDEQGNETKDFDKITGAARLRAVFACPPGLGGRVKFRYYFEGFGDLVLPAPPPGATATGAPGLAG